MFHSRTPCILSRSWFRAGGINPRSSESRDEEIGRNPSFEFSLIAHATAVDKSPCRRGMQLLSILVIPLSFFEQYVRATASRSAARSRKRSELSIMTRIMVIACNYIGDDRESTDMEEPVKNERFIDRTWCSDRGLEHRGHRNDSICECLANNRRKSAR